MEENKALSDKEKQWIRLLADGKSTNDAAKELGIAPGTFSYKLSLLRSKLGCRNVASLMAFVYKNKMVD